ncbi:MAG: LiaI-LiaF-like domain-containing protein [Bryobacteraceae bacterium]
MTEFTNSETPIVGYCRVCGKALTQESVRPAQGTLYCEEHFPVQQTTSGAYAGGTGQTTGQSGHSPYTSPYTGGDPGASPGLAFVLGLIPGVGAIYNGQYAKGLVHVVILGLLISILASEATGGMEPLFGLLTAIWIIYMPFEAYHTALKRQRGEVVDEFSSIVPVRQQPAGFPVGPVILIALGVIFLLNTMEIVRLYQIMRYWPVFLIALGVYLLYARVSDQSQPAPRQGGSVHSTREAPREQ